MKVHHYSERGLMNALVQAITSKADGSLLPVMFDNVFSVDSGLRLSYEFLNLGRPLEVEVFVEPSLSEFGAPDAVILVKGPQGNPIAFYVEAKLCPFFTSSRQQPKGGTAAYRKNASTILHELYMKASLHQELKTCQDLSALSFKVYADESRPRKLGKDPQVLNLAKRLAKCKAYYLAITTDPSRDAVETWTWGEEVSKSVQQMECWNHTPVKRADKGLDLSNLDLTKPMTISPVTPSVREQWHKAVVHLSWSDVLKIAREKGLKDLVAAINENKGKFSFPPMSIEPDMTDMTETLKRVWELHGLKGHGIRKNGRETLYPPKGRRAFATYAVVNGLEGPEVELYIIHKGREQKPEARMTMPLKILQRCLMVDGQSPELIEALQEWKALTR